MNARDYTRGKLSRHVLLVDGDNFKSDRINDVVSHIQKRGTLIVFRVYADFTKHQAWARVIQNNGRADSRFVCSERKQAVDMEMALDGFECIVEKGPCTLCIASGDQDFIPLIRKAHERDCRVIGYATNKSVSRELQKSCDAFVHMHNNPPKSHQPGKKGLQSKRSQHEKGGALSTSPESGKMEPLTKISPSGRRGPLCPGEAAMLKLSN